MALPALLVSLSLSTRLDRTTVGNAMAVALAGTKRLALTINGLTGSGATLAIDGSRDGAGTWVSTGLRGRRGYGAGEVSGNAGIDVDGQHAEPELRLDTLSVQRIFGVSYKALA